MKLTAPPLLAVLALSAGSAMAQRPQSLAAKAEVSASDFMLDVTGPIASIKPDL